MTRDLNDYFERRIAEEERLAEIATHDVVKARHAEFAATYRRRLGKADGAREPDGGVPA